MAQALMNEIDGNQEMSQMTCSSCSICLDKIPKTYGIQCNCDPIEYPQHFICTDYFSPFVESICDDFGKLKHNKFEIGCPVPGCPARHWEVSEIRRFLQGPSLDKYFNTLVHICHTYTRQESVQLLVTDGSATGTNQMDIQQTCGAVLDMLNIRCPNRTCRMVLDPNPDGCCAVKCLHCATHVCWLCFSMFDSTVSCHTHVATCSLNFSNNKSMFVSKAKIAQAQNIGRVRMIRELLCQEYCRLNPNGNQQQHLSITAQALQQSPEISHILDMLQKDLSDVGITTANVLDGYIHVEERRDKDLSSAAVAVHLALWGIGIVSVVFYVYDRRAYFQFSF